MVEGSQPGTQLMWSTFPQFNTYAGSSLREPSVVAGGTTDEINIFMDLPLQQNESVQRVTMVSAFQYELSKEVKLKMQGLCILDQASPLPGSSLYYAGFLRMCVHGCNIRIHLPQALYITKCARYVTHNHIHI